MRRATAEKVADLLGLVEGLLEAGRPRKAPGKPRPEAVNFFGGTSPKALASNLFLIDKVSLVGAFRIAAKEQGYSRNVIKWAVASLLWGSNNGHLATEGRACYDILRQIDDEAWDTRWLRRDIRRARKTVERVYVKDSYTPIKVYRGVKVSG